MPKIIFDKPRIIYAEIPQTNEILFSLAKKEGDVLIEFFSPFKCREFFNDILYACEKKCYINIYEFKYDATKDPIDFKDCYLTMRANNKTLLNMIKSNYSSIINKIEERMGAKEFTEIYEEDPILYLKIPYFWTKTTFLFSFYTFLIKVASHPFIFPKDWEKELVNYHSNEAQYLKLLFQKKINLSKIIDNFSSIINPYEGVIGETSKTELHSYQIHEEFGFLHTFLGTGQKSIYKERIKKCLC